MNRDALHLSDFPTPRIQVHCEPCGRRGSYSIARAIAEHGDVPLPSFLSIVTKDCERHAGFGTVRCAAIYPQLAANDGF